MQIQRQPVELAGGRVDRDAEGRLLVADQVLDCRFTAHRRPLDDAGGPVGPVHPRRRDVERDEAAGVLFGERFHPAAVEPCPLHPFVVGPVHLPVREVERDPERFRSEVDDHDLRFRPVQVCAPDHAHGRVGPEHLPVAYVHGDAVREAHWLEPEELERAPVEAGSLDAAAALCEEDAEVDPGLSRARGEGQAREPRRSREHGGHAPKRQAGDRDPGHRGILGLSSAGTVSRWRPAAARGRLFYGRRRARATRT